MIKVLSTSSRRDGRLLVVCFISLLVSACQSHFGIEATVRGHEVELSFQEDYFLYSEDLNPCLVALEVYDMGGDLPRKVWDIRSRSAWCVPVKAVRIGVVPEGFAQVRDLLPLEPGGRYRVEADGGDLRSGAGEFSLPKRN